MAMNVKPKDENIDILRYPIGKYPQAAKDPGVPPAVARWKDSSLIRLAIKNGAPITARAVLALAMAGESRILKSVLANSYQPTPGDFEDAIRHGDAEQFSEIVDGFVKAGLLREPRRLPGARRANGFRVRTGRLTGRRTFAAS